MLKDFHTAQVDVKNVGNQEMKLMEVFFIAGLWREMRTVKIMEQMRFQS